MRKLLLSFQLFLTLPAMAQHFEAGINGGFVHYGMYNPGFSEDFTYFQSAVNAPVISAKALYADKHYQYGVEAGYSSFSYKGANMVIVPAFIPIFKYTNTDVPLKVFVNRFTTYRRLEGYAGLFAAYVLGRYDTTVDNARDATVIKGHAGRLSAGAQVGATYFVCKHVGINLDIDAVYNNFATGPLDHNKVSFPIGLGVRYKFADRNKVAAKKENKPAQ